ncbi:16994_t:CDS:2, partial [Acaulospora colombiana]
ISPYTYCDSDTYPGLHFDFYQFVPPDYQDWFRCRLVCRTWKEILGPYPHRTLPDKTDITSHTNTRGITSMYLKRYGILFEIPLEQYKELVGQLTVLRIQQFSGWTPPPNSGHPAGSIKFRNVRFLSISGSDTRPDFWPGLAEACPNLVSLAIREVLGSLSMYDILVDNGTSPDSPGVQIDRNRSVVPDRYRSR